MKTKSQPHLFAWHPSSQPGAMGTGRSEVKEEEWASPIPGDTNGARYPSFPARAEARMPFDKLRANGELESLRANGISETRHV
jgi:hypothetical protein